MSFNNLKQLESELAEHYMFRRFEDSERLYFTDLSDLHIGHKGFDEKSFRKTVDIIAQVPNFLVILGGDSINHANKGSKSSQYEESMTPREQVLHLEKLIAPIKDKIIGKVDGNHDGTRAKEFNDISPMEWFCDRNNIRYFKEYAILHFSMKDSSFTHYIHHRSGSTGKNLNAAKMQAKGEEYRCDVIWGEHTHKRHWSSEVYVDIDLRNQKPVIREQYFVNANTFLNWSGYAIESGYRINKTGINIVEMRSKDRVRNIKVLDMDTFIQLQANS
jgi:predicted phosphodiesterase